MKIFSRATADAKAAENAPAAPLLAPAGMVAAAPAPAAAAPAPEPAAPPAPDLSAVLDANVKEMSEKIARLTNSLEGSLQEKAAFEAKLGAMEDRMRKLSSLTEMISAQYNPFVGDAPSERAAFPTPDVGLAAPPLAAPSAAEMGALSPPLPFGLEAPAAPMPAPAAPAPEPAYAPPAEPAYVEAPAPAPEPHAPARLWDVPQAFESNLLMLGWADMILKAAGTREAAVELVEYYHNLGWIGEPARDQLLAYAGGIALAPPAGDARADWRPHVDVHERSLLFIEKLRAVAARRPE